MGSEERKVESEATQESSSVKRSHWGNRLQFFLAALGYSIGMGSLTRFPYVCMKNGGGAFLIPWFFALLVCGIPLFYVELALGQFSGLSPVTLWTGLCPAFQGIGYANAILSGLVTIYYSMQLTWSMLYVVKSLTNYDVPWRTCGNSWNSDKCFDPASNATCLTFSNITDSFSANNLTSFPQTNSTRCNTSISILPSEEFWNNAVLGVKDRNIENMGSFRWELVLCSMASWLLVFLCLMKGVKTLGKVVYVSATLPYVLITALVVRGLTLDGAIEGLIFYLKPDFATLADHNVWIEASLQVFYSLGPGWGGFVTMASYNRFHHKFPRDAVLISLADALTAFYCGFAVFPVLGFMANLTKMPIKHFAASGVGLSFVVLPQVLAEMPASSIWSVLFFCNIITLGIDSQFGMFDTVLSGIMDKYPKLRKHEILVTAVTTTLFFTIGLPFTTEGGMYLYVLFDWYTHVITVSTVSLLEIVLVSYAYGIKQFSFDVELMLGSQPNFFLKATFLFITPLFLLALVIFGLWNMRAPSYQGYEYPKWSIGVGWLLALVSFLPIPTFAIYAFTTSTKGSVKEKLVDIFTPSSQWVPAKNELVESYRLRYTDKHINDNNLIGLENKSCKKRKKEATTSDEHTAERNALLEQKC